MIKWIFTFGMISCIQVNAQPVFKTSTDDNTLLWEISGKELSRPSYLFGSFHLLCKDDINFSTALKKAVSGSDQVYLELDMDDMSTLLGAFTLMNMKGDKKLTDLYSPENYKRVVDFFKDSLKMSIAMFQRMKPGLLAALLYPKFLGCKNTSSIEDGVMQLAKKSKKEIKGLETMAMQAAVFDSIPYEKQAAELLNAIDSLETAKAEFAVMLNAYKDQRLDEIEKMMTDPKFGIEGDQDILLDDRNKNWVIQLKEILKTNAIFIAVGAGHLVGKNGLISLLRKEGYTLRALENK